MPSSSTKAEETEVDLEFALTQLRPDQLEGLSDSVLKAAISKTVDIVREDRRESQLLYYMPASEDAEKIHASSAMIRWGFGGNRSAKSESCLVECVIQATGIIPDYLRDRYEEKYMKQLRGPVTGRVICQSLVNILELTILPKLRWTSWTGVDDIGGDRGHWGWIPRQCLIDGEWERSWSAKSRTLRILYRNPENTDQVMGESLIQFGSYDQKSEDFASAHLHFVMFDEPPPLSIYNENKMRTMSANGWLIGAMTWPDDPSINVDWLFDEIYEKGTPGPKKDPNYDCFTLRTIDNIHLDQESVRKTVSTMNERDKRVRIYGEHIRFSNRVHELFTDKPREWCFACGEERPIVNEHCAECGSERVLEYCHVQDFAWHHAWPVVWVVDPHPRKDHCSAWVGIDPSDDWRVIAELNCSGDIADLKEQKEIVERGLGLRVVRSLIDPRLAGSPTGHQRSRTWMDEFHAAGLFVDAADPGEVGRKTIDSMLAPDEVAGGPRLLFHPRCPTAISQFSRFMWDDWKKDADKGQKQRVKEKYDDYPACLRYFANEDPNWSAYMRIGGGVVRGRHYRRHSSRVTA